MATRALINFVDRKDGVSFSEHPGVDKIHVQIYNHYDGYPSGLGVTLADYLQDFIVVNGLGSGQGQVANGIGCLAAQVIKQISCLLYTTPSPRDKRQGRLPASA